MNFSAENCHFVKIKYLQLTLNHTKHIDYKHIKQERQIKILHQNCNLYILTVISAISLANDKTTF
jgi:hypothetical protein